MSGEAATYIKLRDGFVALAKESPRGPTLDRAWIANEAVASFLPDMARDDAKRERARCEQVKTEIEKLRAKIGTERVTS